MLFKSPSKHVFALRVYVNSSKNNSTLVSYALLLYFNRAMNYVCYYCCTNI